MRYAVWLPVAMVPSGRANSAVNARRTSAASVPYRAASALCPSRPACLRHQAGRPGEVGRGHHLARGVRTNLQPVTVAVAIGVAPDQVRIVPVDVLDPGPHGRVGTLEQPAPAVDPPQLDRDGDARVAPGGRAFAVGDQQRGHVAEGPVLVLLVQDVQQPAADERGHVGLEAGGGQEDLRVGGPAEPLVALRAVGRDADVVAALAPGDVADQLGDHRIGALQLPRRRKVAGQHDPRSGRWRRGRRASRSPRRSGSRAW